MKMLVFAVRDVKAEAYGQPFFCPSVGLAVRSFTNGVNNASNENQLYVHTADFALFQIGEYDDSMGQLLPCTPKIIVEGMQVKTQIGGINDAQE